MTTAHARIANHLLAEISDGTLQPGTRIPGEIELMAIFGVSRNTVRRALDTLTNTKMIDRYRGKGTFVAEQAVSPLLGDLRSFTDIIIQRGMTPGIRDVRVVVDPAPPDAARMFLPGSPLWLVERTRTANGRLFGFMQSWIPDRLGQALTVDALKGTQSLYRLLEQNLGIKPAAATELIRAEAADSRDSTSLGVPEGTPLLSTFRWTQDQDHNPFEYVRSASPGTLYEYTIELRQ